MICTPQLLAIDALAPICELRRNVLLGLIGVALGCQIRSGNVKAVGRTVVRSGPGYPVSCGKRDEGAGADRILYGAPLPDGSTPFWRMQTLWAAAAGKPVTTVELNVLNILDDVVWFGGPDNVQPTVRRVAEHAQAMLDADLTYPIIMTKSGEVLDGAHRIAKAHLQGLTHVAAIVIEDWPPADGVVQGQQ